MDSWHHSTAVIAEWRALHYFNFIYLYFIYYNYACNFYENIILTNHGASVSEPPLPMTSLQRFAVFHSTQLLHFLLINRQTPSQPALFLSVYSFSPQSAQADWKRSSKLISQTCDFQFQTPDTNPTHTLNIHAPAPPLPRPPLTKSHSFNQLIQRDRREREAEEEEEEERRSSAVYKEMKELVLHSV